MASSNSRIKGITIELSADASNFQKTIKSLNSNLNDTNKTLKDVNNLLKFDPTNTNLLSQKQELLKEKVDTCKEKLEEEKQKLSELKDADQTPECIEQQKILEREIVSTTEDLKRAEEELKNFGTVGGQQIAAVGAKMQEVGAKITSVGDSITSAGQKMSVVSGAIAAVGASAVKTAADFDTTMSQVAASMGTTTDQIEDIREAALELGETTSFSASEAAEGFNILAQAGYSADEQIAMMPGILDLAAAGATDLASAATYVTGAINGFSDSTKTATDYADMIASGATLAKTGVDELGTAFSSSAANAAAYGQSAETVMVELLALADANTTGEEAATRLSRVMADLYTPTDAAAEALDKLGVSCYDETGQAKDLQTVLADVQEATSKMSEEEKNATLNTIFTTNGLKGYNAICAESSEKMETFNSAMSDFSGSAATQADTQLDNLNGQITLLKSAIEGAAISIGESLTPMIESLVSKIQELVDWFNSLDADTQQMIVTIALVVAAIGPVLIIIGTLVSSIGSIISAGGAVATFIGGTLIPLITGTIIPAITAFATTITTTVIPAVVAFVAANLPVIAIIAAVVVAIIAIIAIIKNWDAIVAWFKARWSDAMDKIHEAIENVKQKIHDKIESIKEKFQNLKEKVEKVVNFFKEDLPNNIKQGMADALQHVKDKIQDIKDKFTDLKDSALSWGSDMIQNFINGIAAKFEALKESVKGIGETIKSFLGFSIPETGPLHDADKWMPDMVDLMASTLTSSTGRLKPALQNTAQTIADGVSSTGATGSITAQDIYDAVRLGASDATITMTMNSRELARSIRAMGV